MVSFLNRLFRKKASPDNPASKPDLGFERAIPGDVISMAGTANIQAPFSTQVQLHLDVPQLIVGVAQSVGIQRDHNEDSLFTLTTNLLVDEKTVNFGLFIIADGMGGHDNGELASRLAVDRLASHAINALYLPLISSTVSQNDYSLQEVLQAGMLQAHHAIKKETDGGGTTLTAALILGDQVTLIHVGDSRAYYIDPVGDMKLLTRDHSLVKRLEEIGQISSEQAQSDPRRNVLYRAVGQGEPFEPDTTSFHICPGCQLLICSDGLWGVVPDENIATIACSSIEPQVVCQSLIYAANQAGGPDNISVIIIRLPR